jgi:phosphodiesterase/alkaline phosphatase D-like protein
MAPVEQENEPVILEIMSNNGKWKEIAATPIDNDARTATFNIENWESKRDIPYRLIYRLKKGPESFERYEYTGTVRKDPTDRETLKVAAFTGNNDLGFPNNDLVENVKKHDPDMMFFSGDQIYEGVGGYGVQRSPIEKSTLDYLRKWYLYGWSHGELFRDRPVVAIPDDHDVYHGNIWGEGGKATGTEGTHFDMQDRGGYKQPARWVNMVQRTQTSHLPEPFDPTPVKQEIGVYYTDLIYGGISFAVIEDRKWKSAPRALLPEAEINNGWIQNPDFDPVSKADIPEAVLLGQRQLDFLEHWAADWTGGAIMKAVLSQTIFANVATLPRGERHDNIVPKLRILEKGEYAPDDYPVADMDSNGWPQTGRNNALKKIRKASAVHIAGDQHLGSTIQYGIEEFRDGPFAICVPSVSNVWPRRWYPPESGMNHAEGQPQYTGDFFDGFGNRMTVLAVSNPVYTGREPSNLYDRATGYGIIEFNKATREITMANWERDADPTQTDSHPYDGWPITVSQFDNDGREPAAYLPEITVTGLQLPPVVLVYNEKNELVYAVRYNTFTVKPHVYEAGNYVINIGEPGTQKWKELKLSTNDPAPLKIEF